MFTERVARFFYWALGIIITGVIALIFYLKEQEVKDRERIVATNCMDFHEGTFVYYFNGLKPNKKIFIKDDVHLEYENDSSWIKSRINRKDDCHYSLEIIGMNTSDTLKKIGFVIEIKIDKTEQDTMSYRVNRSGVIKPGRLVKISDQANLPAI